MTEGASVTGLPSQFTPAENQIDSTATTIAGLVVDFNALLAKLKAAALMEPTSWALMPSMPELVIC